jgi:hypothetical protein
MSGNASEERELRMQVGKSCGIHMFIMHGTSSINIVFSTVSEQAKSPPTAVRRRHEADTGCSHKQA